MYFELTENVVVKCKKCGKNNIIDRNFFDITSSSYERQMGPEVTHEFYTETICLNCENYLSCVVRVYEYPMGAINYTDKKCLGGIFIEEPKIKIKYEEENIEQKQEEKQMIDKLVELSDNRFKKSKCWVCSYRKNCPHDCGKCLHYIHTPSVAPAPRKYDCGRMCDYYVCKYSHKYMSELYYAFYGLNDLKNIEDIKVLSIGCGPCTDMLALEQLHKDGVYHYKTLEYRGVEIDTRIWKKIHSDIKQIAPKEYAIEIIPEDACDYVDKLINDDWRPHVIVFQYVFSDLQKHSDESKIMHLLSVMGNYISQCCGVNTYIVCNDINLSRTYNGGREFFDILRQNISCAIKYSQRHFRNSNKRSHYNYGDEYNNNILIRNIPKSILSYEPYDSCASAQMIIKKVNNDDN